MRMATVGPRGTFSEVAANVLNVENSVEKLPLASLMIV